MAIPGWSGDTPIAPRAILVAAIGMTVPVLIGYLAGHLDIGFTIGLGAVLLAGPPSAAASPQDRPKPQTAVAPALLAVLAATLIAPLAWADEALIALVGVAALLTGYSRPLAIAAIRFSIYLVLSASLLEGAAGHRGSAALIFGIGALWNVAIRTMLHDRDPVTSPDPAAKPARVPTPAQRRTHWRRTLRTLAGWQFPIRLAAGLAIASAIRHHWPAHHYYWIMLTVVLLTQRPIEHLPTKTIERMIGTVAGVALTWAILAGISAHILLALIVCLLAAAIPAARARSYALYSALSTPLILIAIDLGRPIETALLADRLAATLIGAAIVIAGNLILDRLQASTPPTTPRESAGR